MNISQRGIDLIKSFEGYSATAYKDSVGVWTIGYGHTKTAHAAMVIDESMAENLLRIDLDSAVVAVNKNAPNLTQNQFDACVSFVFNLGAGAFIGSTVLKRIRSSDYVGAALRFMSWDNAGGKAVEGLTMRREREAKLFLTTDDA